MLRDFTWTEKYEEAMPDEHPLTEHLRWLLLLIVPSLLQSFELWQELILSK